MTRLVLCTIGAFVLVVLLLLPGVVSADYMESDTILEAGDWVGHKIGVHPETHNIYAPQISDAELRVFDSSDYSLIASIRTQQEEGGSLDAVDFNPSEGVIYAAGTGHGNNRPKIWVIDDTEHSVETVLLSDDKAMVYAAAFNPTSDKIYVTDYRQERLYIVDASTYSKTSLGVSNCRGVAVNPDTNKVYVAKFGTDGAASLVVVDGDSNDIIAEVGLPDYSTPAGVAVNNETNKVYVVLQASNEVAVIDTDEDNNLEIISLGSGGVGYAYHGTQKIWSVGVLRQCNEVFTVNFELGKLYVIDGETDSLDYVVDIEPSSLIFGVGVEQTGPCRVYVGNNVGNKITVFQDPTGCAPAEVTGEPEISAGPQNESNKVGDCHQIPVFLTNKGGELYGDVKLVMDVSGANNLNVNQKVTTDAEGKAVFSYCMLEPGVESIHIFADLDEDGVEDSGEPSIDLSKTWMDDTDSDGIPDDDEGVGDGDGDGVPNYLDTDSDGDGIPDRDEGTGDIDGDGIPNYLDTDSDGDGVPDEDEGVGDADMDGVPDYLDGNTDGSQDPWWPPSTTDTDGDGIPDYMDMDSDNDGIPDGDEGTGDADDDGTPNYLDTDSDGDGVSDSNDNCPYTPNQNQADSDEDGIGDACETSGETDSDGDGIPDDEDNCPNTANEEQLDSDGDGIGDKCDDEPHTPIPEFPTIAIPVIGLLAILAIMTRRR